MTDFNRFSPEWAAIRAYAAARVLSLKDSLCERLTFEKTQDIRTRIEELNELVKRFEPDEIAVEPEVRF